jgi:hypothetical protein
MVIMTMRRIIIKDADGFTEVVSKGLEYLQNFFLHLGFKINRAKILYFLIRNFKENINEEFIIKVADELKDIKRCNFEMELLREELVRNLYENSSKSKGEDESSGDITEDRGTSIGDKEQDTEGSDR